MEKQIEISCATIIKRDIDLALIVYKDDYDVEYEDVVLLDKELKKMFDNDQFYVITDFSDKYNKFSKEAQNYLAKDGMIVNQLLCSAVDINNLPIRMIARFFINFFKPQFPMKIFSSRLLARQWIDKLRESCLV
jgi:hypothetical protein